MELVEELIDAIEGAANLAADLQARYEKVENHAIALEAENDKLRHTLKGIWDMAYEDIREGTEGVFTSQIEADARNALKEPTPI